ncbi:SseB family protein [Streptomyces sp. NPDC004726]
MALKNIPDPGFSDDDGTADPRLAAALAAWAADGTAERPVLEALLGARLLIPVVARLGEAETVEVAAGSPAAKPGRVLRREKTSDMAVPVLTAGDRRALPAFTSIESLHRWDPGARPIAVPLGRALQAASHEQADTVVLDLAGPVPYQLTGSALLALAEGRTSADPLDDPAVTGAVREVAAAEPSVIRAHLLPGDTDGTLALVLAEDADPAGAARRVAEALAGHDVLRARLVRGLDLALLPAAATPPGEPFFVRE